MLNKFDEYPIHQTPEPIAHVGTTDRNAYDRTWFNGYAEDGSYYFGFGMAVYPHRGIIDGAFSVVRRDGRQHCFFASARASNERTDMRIGPYRMEIVEPMRKTRVIIDDNETGLACDLTFSARTAPIEEARQILWQGAKRTMDSTRFDLFGRWDGVIRDPDGEIKVDGAVVRGTKDRSWGVRRVGEPETGGAPVMPAGICFVWAPLFWDDHITHAIFFDDENGHPLVREGLTAPLFSGPDAIPTYDPLDRRMATARHRIDYHPGTRLARYAELDLVEHSGETRTITMEPVLKFQMKGLGYFHPTWGQGMWKGEMALGSESFDPKQLDPLAPENIHVQQVVRLKSGDRTGIGALEQVCIGPYAPAGFTQFLDGAKA
jgi:hypothetical protein